MLPKNYHEDPSVLHLGAMPPRAYYVPQAPGQAAMPAGREALPCFTSLNGGWDFLYLASPALLTDALLDADYPFPDTLPVPSVWQNHGYGKHQYTNIRYPFPYDPPYVPAENPCGVYRRRFTVPQDNLRRFINFEGVDSCLYLWVNGVFAGYSQVSHCTSEFEISPHLRAGENTLVAAVLKWCDGSYLEDQDKLRTSGIFRDVYLLSRPQRHVWDYTVNTTLCPDGSARIDAALVLSHDELPVHCRLLSPQGEVLAQAPAAQGRVQFHVPSPMLWNAEAPALYTLVLECGGETICQRVGIRQVSIQNGRLLLNGSPFKLRGVNRHDSDPVTGPAIGYEQALADLRLMRRYNINAIRTSHYPSAPWFSQLCDAYGFYLMAEADLECHGVTALYDPAESGGLLEQVSRFDPAATVGEAVQARKLDFCKKYNRLARDPAFAGAILDRVQRCVIRDKNAASVLFWSLGNEAGYGPNFAAAAGWVKACDPSRPTHYEGSIYALPEDAPSLRNIDLYSRMYPAPGEIEAYFAQENAPKPFVLCEYVHAMGNGPGDIALYQRLIDTLPGLVGGFVWEFCDHAVYAGKAENGKDKYLYGGDFGEELHDGNFCMDGLVYPNRNPHVGLYEFANAVKPVYAVREGDFLCFTSRLDFLNTGAVLACAYEFFCDGQVLPGGVLPLDIPPHGAVRIPLPAAPAARGKCHLNLSYRLKAKDALTGENHALGFDQILLADAPHSLPALRPGALSVSETAESFIITGAGWHYVFSKATALFTEMRLDGEALLQRPMAFNLWRAPTDNDRYIRLEWEKAGYNRARPRVYTAQCEVKNGLAVITCTLSLAAAALQKIMDIEARFEIDAGGAVQLALAVKRNTQMPFLPRFGLRLFLPHAMQQVAYTGYGPHECYVDKRLAAQYGAYGTTPAQNHEDYLRPQENGAHWGCDSVEVTGEAAGLRCESPRPFSFNVSPYTQEELAAKAHNFELEPCGMTVLNLDFAQSGVGSNACGPALAPEYRLDGDAFTFEMHLTPLGATRP